MAKLTAKQRTALDNAIAKYVSANQHNAFFHEILNAINDSEGYPVSDNGDVYEEAKLNIFDCVLRLNNAINDAHTMGLVVSVETISQNVMPAPIPYGQPPVMIKQIFKLTKLYKDFV